MTNFQRTYSTGEVEVKRRRCDLPPHGVPRAPRPLRLLRLHAPDGRVRHLARRIHRRPQRAPRGDRPDAGARRPASRTAGPRWRHQVDLHLDPGAEETSPSSSPTSRRERRKVGGHGADTARPKAGRSTRASATRGPSTNRSRPRRLLGRPALPFQVDSADPDVERMLNTWNQYQCLVTFNLSPLGQLFETGIGRGSASATRARTARLRSPDPRAARQPLLDVAATQLADGTCFHRYQPLTREGNAEIGGGFDDDALWLVVSTVRTYKETGDTSILSEASARGCPGSSGEPLAPPGDEHRVHARPPRPAQAAVDRPRRLDDCLDLDCFSTSPTSHSRPPATSQGIRAESVIIAGLFLYACARARRSLPAHRPARRRDATRPGARRTARRGRGGGVGRRLVRAGLRPAEGPIGSPPARRGRSSSRARDGACSAVRARDSDRARRALDSVHEHVHAETGSCSSSRPTAGTASSSGRSRAIRRVTRRTPEYSGTPTRGSRSPGARSARRDQALEMYPRSVPRRRKSKSRRIGASRTFTRRSSRGRTRHAGRSEELVADGHGGVVVRCGAQGILGIGPGSDGLRMDPCIPRAWPGFRVARRFRGVRYEIAVSNPDGVCGGVRSLTVDGRAVAGNRIPLATGADTVSVEVVLG